MPSPITRRPKFCDPRTRGKRNSLELKLAALTNLADVVLEALRDRMARIEAIHAAAREAGADASPAHDTTDPIEGRTSGTDAASPRR